jgi:exopolyphosphatase / guanosine-5'-triphosphate,3'-diphosphate pyrophosphatase
VTSSPPVGASADLGSTSVHLLVARIEGHALEPLADESAFLGLGAAIDDRGYLGDAGRAELAATLERYAGIARDHGADAITFIATEPLRRAADGQRIVADIERASGVAVHVLAHEEEAFLTIVGVTGGRPVTAETLVVDIGGGSSEFCDVPAHGVARAFGLRLGANRLTKRFVATDPPTPSSLAAMTAAADEALADAPDAAPREVVLVGGTASNLLKVTPGGSADRVLDRARLAAARELLLSTPAADIVERFVVNETRARLLLAGAAIVDALMRRYGAEAIRVSESGMREGTILIVDHAGREWRDHLATLAHGWRS